MEGSWAPEMPRLLVVDDEEPLLEIFIEFFEDSEYQLTIAKSGEEAMELLERQEFDLVVTDLNLPGADGLEVLTYAKRRDPEIEVIVLTGNASTMTAINALRDGAYDYVLKPFDLYEMEQTVRKALERRRLLSENRQFVVSLQRHRDELAQLVDEATWRMRSLYEVGKEITATLDLDRTLNLILEKSAELTRADRGLLFLLDENDEIHCRVLLGIAEAAEAEELWAEALHATNTRVIAEKRAVLAEVDIPGGGSSTAWVVPFLQESEVVGTIVVLAVVGRSFSQDDRDLLVGLASQATIAIHNARVYEKIQALDRMKSEFVAVVSHEVRTPLTAIKGTLEILGDESYFEMPEPQRELLEICFTNVERLETLINDILDFSKLESSRLSTHFGSVHVGSLLGSVVVNLGKLAEQKSIGIETEVSDPLPAIEADELRISQVLTNLLGNAVKFSSENGTIRVRATVDGEGVRLDIEDTGIGISPDDIPKLFTKFRQLDSSSTRTASGTGLGLAISKGIVEEHAGRIWVTSTPGQGSVFSVWLPIEQAVRPGEEPPGRVSPAPVAVTNPASTGAAGSSWNSGQRKAG